jgi:hypothetical protein
VAAQRARLLKLATKEKTVKARSSGGTTKERNPGALPRWLVPLTALSGALALLFALFLLVAVGVGLFWLRSRGVETPPAIVAGGTPETRVARAPTSTPERAETPAREPSPTLTPSPAVEPTAQQAAPAADLLQAPDAEGAALHNLRGLVEFREADGPWTAVPAGGRILRAGDHVRTGALSSAALTFYDGSVAHLGPDAQLSIDELDARRSGGPRVVVLVQSRGESEHEVVPSSVEGARYNVHTPSGTGGANGTRFRVRVTPAQVAHFSVDEGAIWVSHLARTVVVVAGQVTIVRAELPPSTPVFRVTGEGEVQEIGANWTVAGQVFETHEATVIVGNPQLGDWVRVEGRLLPDGARVADVILLLRRSPADRFTVQGRVDAIGESEWTVSGQAIAIDAETDMEAGIERGDLVRVEGTVLEGGTLLARSIVLLEEQTPGLPFQFAGVVQEIGPDTWRVSGVSIAVDAGTKVDEELAVGDLVEVEGWILPDATWLARSIERLEDEEHPFEFAGSVESIAPWVVSGVAFETDEWTEIEPGIGVGDEVEVEGRILQDGAWLATEIKLLGKDLLHVEFVGRVQEIDPWLVSGISLATDDETEIEDEIKVGDWVRVRARILPDGAWLAIEIESIDVARRRGCMWFSSVVARVDPGQIVLGNGATIPLEGGVLIEGEIEVHSVVLILICVGEKGTPTVVSIIVIYQLEAPLVMPTAVAPLLPPPPEGGNVTICHKPGTPAEKTKIIPQSALKGHLGHGDTLGPCRGGNGGHDDDHDDKKDDD